MRVLAIDTAGPVVGVALSCDGVITQRSQRVTKGADALLLGWATELAREAGIRLADLDGVGVAHGPGMFTGIRVGLATAVGLAMAVDVPLWGGSSLVSRAARVRGGGTPVLAMLDARKGRVYARAEDADGVLLAEPGDIPPADALAWMRAPFVATGEGAVVYADLVREAGGTLATEADAASTDALVALAAVALAEGLGAPAQTVRPVYMRAPDAKPGAHGRIKRGS